MSAQALIKNICHTTGEGPHWDERNGQLLFVDIQEHALHRWTESTGQLETKYFGKHNICFLKEINIVRTEKI